MKHRYAIIEEVRGLDEEKREATFVISTERAVQMGDEREVLRVSGVRLDRYKKNAVVLDSHDRSHLGSIIGRADVKTEGRKLVAKVTYAPTARGLEAWELVKGGFIRATSIGYQVDASKVRKLRKGETDGEGDNKVEGPASIVDGWELLEVSNVPVPADEDAVRRSYGTKGRRKMGGINWAKLVADAASQEVRGMDGDDGSREPYSQGGQQATPGENVAEKAAEVSCPKCGHAFAPPQREGGPPVTPFDHKTGFKPGVMTGSSPGPAQMGSTGRKDLNIEIQARTLEACRRAAVAITPKGLEEVTDRALAEGRPLEEIRKLLLLAQAQRFKPVGTMEPAPIEDPSQRAKEMPKEVSDDILVRSFSRLSE